MDRPVGEGRGDRVDDLVVAALDVVALVGAGRALDVLGEQVEGAEPGRVEPELRCHLGPHVLAPRAGGAAGQPPVEPVGDREPVEGDRGGGVIGGAVGADPTRVVEQKALEQPPLGAHRRPAHQAPVQPQPRGAGVRDRVEVGELEPEALRQRPHPVVARVDELAAVLGRLGVVPVARGPAAPADPVGVRLVDGRGDAAVVESKGAGEPGETGADDHDPRLGRGPRLRASEHGRAQRQRRRPARSAPQQLTPRDPPSLLHRGKPQ